MSKRKLILYISMSADGYIATNDDDLSWLSIAEKEGEDYGYEAFTKNIDAYIVGRRTYDVVLNLTGGIFPQAEKFDCYVLSREKTGQENGVTFYSGDLLSLIDALKSKEGKDIYCDGGAEIVRLLMEKNLIDEYLIFVMPIFLGGGIRLFKGGMSRIDLKALPSKYYEKGVTRLHYAKA